MRALFFAVSILFSTPLLSQSLGKGRVNHVKKSVVRIFINDTANGTGFFFSEGKVATCFHVIQSAINLTSNTRESIKTIKIEFPDGERIEVELSRKIRFYEKEWHEAIMYDHAVLELKTTPSYKYETLKLGSFKDVDEGDVIYSNGYPMGIKQNVFTKGIFSTKFTDTVGVYTTGIFNKPIYFVRDQGWIDLTLNKGNSGGPVILLDSLDYRNDIVVGIATFILNPHARDAEWVAQQMSNPITPGLEVMGSTGEFISYNKIYLFIADAISKNSIGVSGAVSIDHLKRLSR